MASSLPSEDGSTKTVQNFGLGPYDSPSDSESRGEDDVGSPVTSLPSESDGSSELEYYLSYPVSKSSSTELPGDSDRPPRGTKPQDLVLNVLPAPASDEGENVANSSLPNDADNPAARSDYYDNMSMGGTSLSDIWADEDTGAYAQDEFESLPTAPSNEMSMDDFLGALGNSDSGYVVEDQAVPTGFPTDKFTEQADFTYDRSNLPDDGGKLLPFGYAATSRTMPPTRARQATNIELVGTLTQEFLKEQGRKGIVRRHVLQFLQDRNLPQFLASDIVRCMKHRHKIVIPDVMDTFPVKVASSFGELRSARNRLIELEIEHVADPPVASIFRRCAANLSLVIAAMERTGN